MILEGLAIYVAARLIDQFIQEEVYGWLKKLLFPKTKHKKRLVEIIYATISEFEHSHNYVGSNNKFPFYYSEIFFAELSKYVFSKSQVNDLDKVKQSLEVNPNIIVPTISELNDFYELFVSKINNDKKLKGLYIDENYKSKIFELETYLERIERKVDKLLLNPAYREYSIAEFTPLHDYIPRKVSTSILDDDFITPGATNFLYDIIVDKKTFPRNKFILYSSAQTGKTTELRNVAYQLQENSSLIPFLIDLNGFIPNETFLRIVVTVSLYKDAIFILDAYDEIKDVYKDGFVRKLDEFIADNPKVPMIISSRINFEDKNNFSSFQPLYLEALSHDDIYDYLNNNQIGEKDLFIEKAKELDVLELLQTPFYLKEMLKYYLSHNDLPKTKSELYQILIDESFEIDEKHKQNKGYVQKLKTKSYKVLQKVAFVMTVCEKKELSEEELTEVIFDSEKVFQTIVHSSIFKRNALDASYSFEHIAFKEFLVAKFLTTISSEDVAQLIFYPDSAKLINSWYNIVLLFLEIIQEEHEKFQSIIDVLLENYKHLIVEASPNFLKKSNRIEIFKKIYNDYKSKRLYIDYFEFRKSLMAFANYQETVLFLLEQLKSESSNANYHNALILLEYADYSKLSDKENIKRQLMDFVSLKLHVYGLRNYLLLPFQREVYGNERDIENIWHVIKNSKQPEILNDFFKLLLELDNVDKYADWIFSIEKYIHIYTDNDGVSHAIYRTDLYNIFDKFRNTENIGKALKCLASELGMFGREKEKTIHIKGKLLLKLEVRFLKTGNNSIVEDVLKAFEKEEFSPFNLDKNELETAMLYKDFFKGTNLTESILNKEFMVWEDQASNNKIDYNRELLIPILITEDIFIDKMKSFDKNDVQGYFLMKHYLPLDEQLRAKLSMTIEQYFTFQRPKFIDLNVENQKDFDLVLNYERFKEEVLNHCDTNCDLIYKFRNRAGLLSENYISNCINCFISNFTIDKKIDIKAVKEAINDVVKYNKFTLAYILPYMDYKNEEKTIKTTEKQKYIINTLVNSTIETGVESGNLEALLGAITFFDFELTSEQIKKFVPFGYRIIPDHVGYKYKITEEYSDELFFSHNTTLLDVLIHKSSHEFVCNQIEEHIKDEHQYEEILYRFFSEHIVKKKITHLYKYLPIIIFDKLVDEYEKERVLSYIAKLEGSFSLIESRFEELSDETKISYFSNLKPNKSPENVCEILWNIYQRTNGSVKIKYLSLLLKNG